MFELAILTAKKDLVPSGLSDEVRKLAHDYIDGNFASVLTSGPWSQLVDAGSASDMEDCLSSIQSNSEKLATSDAHAALLCAATSLAIFIQASTTGSDPRQSSDPTRLPIPDFPLHVSPKLLESIKGGEGLKDHQTPLHLYAISHLDCDDEQAYRMSPMPWYLLLADAITSALIAANSTHRLKTVSLWRCRCLMTRQSLLEYPVPSLKSELEQRFEEVKNTVSSDAAVASLSSPAFDPSIASCIVEIAALARVEEGLFLHTFLDSAQAQECFKSAQALTGLVAELSGSLGMRTKFQSFKTSQLVVKAQSRVAPSPLVSDSPAAASSSKDDVVMSEPSSSSASSLPHQVPLEDYDLLPKMKIDNDDDPMHSSQLTLVDQILLLMMCLNVKNSNPRHGLTSEEMMPFLTRVQECISAADSADKNSHQSGQSNWLVFSLCLLLKSRLEMERRRTHERGIMQIQVLVDQYKDADPAPIERLRFAHSVPYPPLWALKKELADLYLSMGAARSALQIYEEMEHWESIIKCYAVMDADKKAETVAKQRLEVEPENPMLWCLLGDVTKDADCYERAWELSDHRMARAKRSLGLIALRAKDYESAADHFAQALAINPLYPTIWFSHGCSLIQLKRWDDAAAAFTRCVQLEPEDAEAWNNLATIFIQKKQKPEAHRALSEGLKQRPDNWRMWENFLYVSMDIRDLQSALHAMDRIFDINDKSVDTEILGMLVSVVEKRRRLQHEAMAEEADPLKLQEDKFYETRLTEFLGRVSSKISTNAELWSVYARFHRALGNFEKEVDLRQKQVRSLQTSGWDQDKDRFVAAVDGMVELASSVLDLAGNSAIDVGTRKRSLASSRMSLRPVMKRTEQTFGHLEEWALLGTTLARIEEAERSLA